VQVVARLLASAPSLSCAPSTSLCSVSLCPRSASLTPPIIERFKAARGDAVVEPHIKPTTPQRHGADSEDCGTRCKSVQVTGRRAKEGRTGRSRAEAVEGAALALERVDDVERGDGLALGVLSVGDRVADDVLEEAARSAEGEENERRTS